MRTRCGLCEAFIVREQGVPRTGWRRLRGWHWLVVALAVAGTLTAILVLSGGDDDSDGMRACRAVVRTVRDISDKKRPPELLVEVVRQQAPVARDAAKRDPAFQSVADAIEEMRVNLEAGRPWPSIVILYQRCG